jgi:ribosomal-protein-alanine N-acetyltransferase
MTNPLSIPSLRGERITLRPFTMDDAPAVYDYLATPEIASTTHVPYPYPAGAAERWIATHRTDADSGAALTWAITVEDGRKVIGAVALHLTPTHARGEIGYWLGVPHWNQGFTTEAARLIVSYGVEALDLHRIQATCLPHNVGSSRVMEKAGLTFEGILRGYIQRDGIFEDIAMYARIAAY